MRIKRVEFAAMVRHGAKMINSAAVFSAAEQRYDMVNFLSIDLIEMSGFPVFVLKTAGATTYHPFTAVNTFEVLEEKAEEPKPDAKLKK